MGAPTFNPPVPPDPQSSISYASRLNISQFGDGYEQRTIDGLNSLARTATLVWNNLTTSESLALVSFFVSSMNNGLYAFYYVFPGEDSIVGQPILWRQEGPLTRNQTNLNCQTIKVNIKQIFDLQQ